MNVRGAPSPSPGNLDFWREAIAKDRLGEFKLEVLVAALQDLGPETNRRVREPLAFRISNALMRMLRNRVGFNHPNQGCDIIDRVHTELLTALFDPASADGKALRTAFSARVSFRIKDAIATEFKHSRIPTDELAWKAADADTQSEIALEEQAKTEQLGRPTDSDVEQHEDGHELGGSNESIRADCRSAEACDNDGEDMDFNAETIGDADLFAGVKELDETIDNERILLAVADLRKRLAFRLHMNRIPIHSNSGPSIAKALGVDRKTVGSWIAEVQEQLSQHKEVTLLDSATSGGRQ
ncbi:hypothetical protein [Rhizobium sp. CNPSo 3490]|uniref:hypothetical protein n=1 Tax=Rhizobium sp. CNPSo 3490 TaxID=3021407 RepID=UPI0025513ECA|nr:hypothetical protein [Rhizobium sp. CNPSo 3490]MDK4732022.1 hypothetical protein [Rhizobium sp. CNPSo 3490]